MLKSAISLPSISHNPHFEARDKTPSALIALYACLVCAVLLGLSACAQAPKKVAKKVAAPLVFPLPPDEARFVYERTIRTSHDVDTSVADTSLQDLLTGRSVVGANVPLRKPYAIAVHQGRLFVSEPTTRVVKVFDVPGKKYFTIGDTLPGMLQMPVGLAVDGVGNLYVADVSAKAVMVYNRDGVFLRKLAAAKIGEPKLFERLTSVAVDKKGEKLYALDIAGTSATPEYHRVRVFNAKTGAHLFDFGKRGSGPGEFNLARDLVLDKDNNLFVVDGGNARIQVFNAEGKFLRQFGGRGMQLGDFSRPKEIALDTSGNIYVVDTTFSHFQIFTPDGKLLMPMGSGSNKDAPANYRLVSGIDVDEDGRIYFVDQQFRKIDIFRPANLGVKQGYLAGELATDKVKMSSPQALDNLQPSPDPDARVSDVQPPDAKLVDEKILNETSPSNGNSELFDELLPE